MENISAEIQRLEEWTDDKKPKACEHCKYYIKHYIKNDLMFMEINAGHCTRGRSTKRRKHDDSCKFFELGRYEMR